MKVRLQHVSNSSTSSHIILGFSKKDIIFDDAVLLECDEGGIWDGEFDKQRFQSMIDCLRDYSHVLNEMGDIDESFGAGVRQIDGVPVDNMKTRSQIMVELGKYGVHIRPGAPLRIYTYAFVD